MDAPFLREVQRCSRDGCGRELWSKGLCKAHLPTRNKPRSKKGREYKPRAPRVKTSSSVGSWMTDRKGYVYRIRSLSGVKTRESQHRVIMAEMLGRPLLPNEEVHHRNGVRHDNRPENLEIWVSKQPRGQRPQDLVAYAKEILSLYSDFV